MRPDQTVVGVMRCSVAWGGVAWSGTGSALQPLPGIKISGRILGVRVLSDLIMF